MQTFWVVFEPVIQGLRSESMWYVSIYVHYIKEQQKEYVHIIKPLNLKLRHIVAGPICRTRPLSNLIDILLDPFLLQIKSYA